jgi:type I restriction enzyme S subunit
VDSYIDEPDYEEESLIIGDGGEPNINYGVKFSTSDHCYILQNKNSVNVNLKYVYYYLLYNLDIMKRLYTGVGIKNISKTSIENIRIVLPDMEQQCQIVEYCDFNTELIQKMEQEMENNFQMALAFMDAALLHPPEKVVSMEEQLENEAMVRLQK